MRVFILGAGSSFYAGFPLGKDLWDFLVDHCGLEMGAMETICAYLSTLDSSQRADAIVDLEGLLTKLERGLIPPMPAEEKSISGYKDWDEAEKHALKSSMRHMHQNDRKLNFDALWEAQRIRRASPVTTWATGVQLTSIKDLISNFVSAFLLHHACIRFGRRHFSATHEPCPTMEQLNFSRCCPCRQRSRIGTIHRTFDAIARMFQPGDTIITFNYDATVEASLWARRKWNFTNGYGFPVDIASSAPARPTRSTRLLSPSPIKVLKAHGSINWVKNTLNGKIGINYLGLLFDLPGFSTYEPSYDPEDGMETEYTEDTLLAPTYMKDYSSEPTLRIIWDQIDDAVKMAAEVTVIGYSLPKGDTSARERLACALRHNKSCATVTVVSPGVANGSEWPPFLDSVKKHIVWKNHTFEKWVSNAATDQRRGRAEGTKR
jgi:hypothetical protein